MSEHSDKPGLASVSGGREDPTQRGAGAVPWLVFFLGLVLSFLAGLQVGQYQGGFDSLVYYEGHSSPLAFLPAEKSRGVSVEKKELSLADEGKIVYGNCVPCHQAGGNGLPGQFPPLVAADWVTGSEKRLIAILLKGIQGPFKVNGSDYNGAMPSWEKALSDRKIAAVASFIRSSWGNSASEIDERKVAAVRIELSKREAAWTEAELLSIPEGEPIEASSPARVGGSDSAGSSPVQGAQAVTADSNTEVGKQVYATVCAACHQPTGKGLPPVFPPLENTDYVKGPNERLIAIVLKGIIGPITVNGATYNNVMPAQESTLSDEKIAAVLSYVRSAFASSGEKISVDMVRSVRSALSSRGTGWIEAELLAFEKHYQKPQ